MAHLKQFLKTNSLDQTELIENHVFLEMPCLFNDLLIKDFIKEFEKNNNVKVEIVDFIKVDLSKPNNLQTLENS